MQLMEERKNRLVYLIIMELALFAVVVILDVPIFWMLSTSLKAKKEIFPSKPNFEAYVYVWNLVPFARYLFNSFFVATSVGVSRVILASMAAFAFAKISFKGSKQLFYVFLGTMMIPFEVIVILNYIIVKTLGWLDTYAALIVPFSISAFSIFLLRQFFLGIPRDLDDAAEIDGAGKLRYLFTIVYPLAKPALLTVGLYSYLESWNSFLWPLIVTNKDIMRVVQIGLAALGDKHIPIQ
ncbi:MAG TPA: carbohydrate ABC transporter permease [bacterium]|nr:carbohydrate ABC transporter permease [bacterium]